MVRAIRPVTTKDDRHPEPASRDLTLKLIGRVKDLAIQNPVIFTYIRRMSFSKYLFTVAEIITQDALSIFFS